MPRVGVALVAVAIAAAAVICHAAAGSKTGKAPQVLLLGRFEPGPEGDSSIGELPQVRSLHICAREGAPYWQGSGSDMIREVGDLMVPV